MPRVLVSCCGLPAAGKTTFCRAVSKYATTNNLQHCGSNFSEIKTPKMHVFVSHVCFDAYTDEARRCLQDSTGIRETVNATDLATLNCKKETNGSVKKKGDQALWWHEGRQRALAAVEALAAMERLPGEQEESHGGAEKALHIVLADDNMHFRSMRHEILRLARVHGCGYAQVYFPMDPDIAIKRDIARVSSVTEAVIRKMASNLQPPDPARYSWERHTVVFHQPSRLGNNASNLADMKAYLQVSERGAGLRATFTEDAPRATLPAMRAFWKVIANATDDPVPPLPASPLPSHKEADREVTSASVLHRIDLDLREATKRIAERVTGFGLPCEVLRTVMKACSTCRKDVMQKARACERYHDSDGQPGSGNDHHCCDTCSPQDSEESVHEDAAQSKHFKDRTRSSPDRRAWNFLEIFSAEFEASVVGGVEALPESLRAELLLAAMNSGHRFDRPS